MNVNIDEFNTDEGREYINGLLHNERVNDLSIVFTKKDGTNRTILPTLIESRIPTAKKPKEVDEDKKKKLSSAVARVFDTEVNEWRSFRWESVTGVSFSVVGM